MIEMKDYNSIDVILLKNNGIVQDLLKTSLSKKQALYNIIGNLYLMYQRLSGFTTIQLCFNQKELYIYYKGNRDSTKPDLYYFFEKENEYWGWIRDGILPNNMIKKYTII